MISERGVSRVAQIAEYENFIRSRITQLRQNMGVSEHKMSLDLGKSGGYLRAISVGNALPSMHEFLRICEYLQITPEEFFIGCDSENTRTDIVNRLRDLSDEDLQKTQTFIGWLEGK